MTIATTTTSHKKKKKGKPLYVSNGTANLVAVIETMFQEPVEIPAPCSKFHAAKISGRLGSGHMQAIPRIFFFGPTHDFSRFGKGDKSAIVVINALPAHGNNGFVTSGADQLEKNTKVSKDGILEWGTRKTRS